MIFCVLDAETDGLLDEVSKIYCVSYSLIENGKVILSKSLTDYDSIRNFIANEDKIIDYFVGHNIIAFDNEVFKLILNQELGAQMIDTLGMSYYLFPDLKTPGLEYFGKVFKVPKPFIEDWKKGTIEEYVHRCEEDVKINSILFINSIRYLIELYTEPGENISTTFNRVLKLLNYLSFKMDCLREQYFAPIELDMKRVEECYEELCNMFIESTEKLSEVIPAEFGKIFKKRPAKPFKKDGGLSSHGERWLKYLEENNLPLDTEVVREKPNPGSVPQLKAWLYSLGWVPITFKDNDNGEKVPQVSLPFGGGLCPSVKALINIEPNIELLSTYYKIRHRKGIFAAYLSENRGGKVVARAQGFTKTLRLGHAKPIANLPKPSAWYGKNIRGVMIAPEGYVMCGSDVSSLEDSTKQHYIYFYDPEYVKDMQKPGFDPHLDIGVLAKIIKEEDSELYKKYKSSNDEEKETFTQDMLDIVYQTDKNRGTSKATNFSATYGAGADKIAETAKIPLELASELHRIYWERNKAIKLIAKDCRVKSMIDPRGTHSRFWLYNPISGFWIVLSNDKDRFSALNQNTGVFVFDCWLRFVRKEFKPLGIKISMQYHDEIMFYFKEGLEGKVKEILVNSMEKVNDMLKLNINIKISVDFGKNYAEVH